MPAPGGIIDNMPPDPALPESSPAAAAGRPGWAATTTAGRALLVAAAVLAVLAVLVLVQSVRLPRQHRVRQLPGPVTAAVDAAGCPVGARCRIGSTAPPAMLAALQEAFPQARVTSALAVYDAADGRPFRVTVTADIESAGVLTLLAQRLPGAPANDPEFVGVSDRTHTDLSGNQVVQSRLVRVLAPGRPGYSLSLLLSYPGPGPGVGYDDAALRLARNRDAQLSP